MSQVEENEVETEDAELAELERMAAESQVEAAKRRAERSRVDRKNELESKIRANEIEAACLDALPAFETKHGAGEVKAIVGRHGFVIVKRPASPTYRKFIDLEKTTSDDLENLVRPCLLTPANDFDKLVQVEPAMLLRVANACTELAGVRASDVAGK